MKFYIFLSVVVATLFFCANSEVCGWGYNLALSLLVLFLYWVRLIPSRLLESLNSAAAISIVTTLFLISSILLPAVRSEAMAVTAVFFHELIFLILSFRFAGLARAFGILTFGAFLASALLLCPDLQAGRNELSNWICVGLNLFFVAAALFLTYADIRIICLKVDKIFIPIILALGALFFILVAGYRDGGANGIFFHIAFSLLICSVLSAFLVLMGRLFGSNGREAAPLRFSAREKRKYQEVKNQLRWIRLKRRVAGSRKK